MFKPSMVPRPNVADQMCRFMRTRTPFPTRGPDHFHVTTNGQGVTPALDEDTAKDVVKRLDRRHSGQVASTISAKLASVPRTITTRTSTS